MTPNLFYSVLYNLALSNAFPRTKFSRRIQKWYAKSLEGEAKDRPVVTRVNHQWLICPFSHKLPFYQKDFPTYDRQLAKLCSWMHGQLQRAIKVIDVGANVGDTVVNIGLKDAFYLCVEGDGNYSHYLTKNLNHRYRYSLEQYFLTDQPDNGNYSFTASKGTGRLTASDKEVVTGFSSLDELLREKYENMSFDLVKVDTDGFDFKVIRGAGQSLREWHPLLFFEWDKVYCKEQGEDPLSIFPILEGWGYSNCILFDNFGKVVDLVKTNDRQKLGVYMDGTMGEGLPCYYDVLAVNTAGGFSVEQLYNLFVKG